MNNVTGNWEEMNCMLIMNTIQVKAALGEDVTAEQLGGADLHCRCRCFFVSLLIDNNKTDGSF